LDHLAGEKLMLSQDILSAVEIRIQDQNIYVLTGMKEGFVRKFDLNGGFIESSFQVGSGPGEVLYLSNFGFVKDKDIDYSYGNDKIQNKMVYFSKGDTIDIPFSILLFHAFPTNDNEILGVPVESDKMFNYYDFSGNQTRSFGNYPKSKVTDMNYILSQAFVGAYDYSRSNNTFVAGLKHTDYLMIFSDIGKEEVYSEVRGPLYYDPIFTVSELSGYPMFTQNNKMRFSYVDVIATDNKIIGLFSGYSVEEKAMMAHYGDKIFIFDYSGKIIKGFEISEKLISLAYDDVKNMLYGLDVSGDEEEIIKYSLD